MPTVPVALYQRLLKRGCGICGKLPPPKQRLDTDHDHATGAFRGLLCGLWKGGGCNARLDVLEKHPERVPPGPWRTRALAYLAKHARRQRAAA